MGYTATDSQRTVFAAQLKLAGGGLSNVKLFEVTRQPFNQTTSPSACALLPEQNQLFGCFVKLNSAV